MNEVLSVLIVPTASLMGGLFICIFEWMPLACCSGF